MLLKYLSVILSKKNTKSFFLGIVYGVFLNFSSIAMNLELSNDYGYPGPSLKPQEFSNQKNEFAFEDALEASEKVTSDNEYFFEDALAASEKPTSDKFYFLSAIEPLKQTSHTQSSLPNISMSNSISLSDIITNDRIIQSMKDLIRLGLSHEETSTIVERPLSAIQRLVRGERTGSVRPFSPAEFKNICQLDRAGLSFDVISRRTGFSVIRIKYYLMSLQESDNIGNINNMSNEQIRKLKNTILERVRQMPLAEKLNKFK